MEVRRKGCFLKASFSSICASYQIKMEVMIYIHGGGRAYYLLKPLNRLSLALT